MRKLLLVFFAVSLFVLVGAPAADAAVPISYKDYPMDNANPTVTLCVAYSANNQACRKCHENLYPSGASMGWVCKPVYANSSCTCKFEHGGCTSQGECFYR